LVVAGAEADVEGGGILGPITLLTSPDGAELAP